MKRTLIFLGFVGFLILLSTAILSYRLLSYGTVPLSRADDESPVAATDVLQVEQLSQPSAVLVLDVSGSMKQSDPRHLQTEAVIRFFDIFADLAVEIEGEAEIAVVLFATVAQVIDWGREDPWLEVKAENRQLFNQTLEHYLGRESEPRVGQKTDYLFALQEATRLIQDRAAPPLVIFMTDGESDPHPVLTGSLSTETKAANFPQEYRALRQTLEDLERGAFRFLSSTAGRPEMIFDQGRRGLSRLNLPHALEEQTRTRIRAALQQLLSQRWRLSELSPSVAAFWAPVYLGSQEALLAQVREVLVPEMTSAKSFWEWDRGFIHCRESQELTSAFVDLLAHWLRLPEMRFGARTEVLQIPQDTQAFAVVLTLEQGAPSAVLSQNGSHLNLAGSGQIWAGVGYSGGAWAIDTTGSAIRESKVYLRPRYDWVLRTPEFVRVSGADSKMRLALSLYSVESRQAVQARRVFHQLPPRLKGAYQTTQGTQGSFQLLPPEGETEDTPVAYQAEIPLRDVHKGELLVRIDLGPLKDLGLPIFADNLERSVPIRPSIRLVVRDAEGRETGIHLKRYPLAKSVFQRFWNRLTGGEAEPQTDPR